MSRKAADVLVADVPKRAESGCLPQGGCSMSVLGGVVAKDCGCVGLRVAEDVSGPYTAPLILDVPHLSVTLTRPPATCPVPRSLIPARSEVLSAKSCMKM